MRHVARHAAHPGPDRNLYKLPFLPVGMLLVRVFFRFEAVIGTIRVESAGFVSHSVITCR